MTHTHPEPETAIDGSNAASVVLCVQLWAREGRSDELRSYEDRVLALLPDHGARVVVRAATTAADGVPSEVQVLEFPTEESIEQFKNDERRVVLADVRDAVIARTEMFRVTLI